MPKKINVLVAVDGSESSMGAVRYAGGFFDPGLTGMTLIHVLTIGSDVVDEMKKIGEQYAGQEEQNSLIAARAGEMMAVWMVRRQKKCS